MELILGSPLFLRLQIKNIFFVILCNYIVDNATFEDDVYSNYNISKKKTILQKAKNVKLILGYIKVAETKYA